MKSADICPYYKVILLIFAMSIYLLSYMRLEIIISFLLDPSVCLQHKIFRTESIALSCTCAAPGMHDEESPRTIIDARYMQLVASVRRRVCFRIVQHQRLTRQIPHIVNITRLHDNPDPSSCMMFSMCK